MSLRNDLLRVSGSNLIVMLSSIVNGLVLPYVLSIDAFADIKTYTLYASFIGFLHFGFVDGLNIKYGGQTVSGVDTKEFNSFHNFFITFQLFIIISFLIIAMLLNNDMMLLVGLAILPINLQSFFLYYFQAIGEFKEYSKTTIIVPVITITITLAMVYANVLDYRLYVLASIFGYFISIMLLERRYYVFSNNRFKINLESINILKGFRGFKAIFLSGFFIMLGNVLFTLFFDTGRWMSKLFTSNEDFAIYSLGVSMIGFVMVFVGAVNRTFYPYLYRNNEPELLVRYKNILYVIGTLSLVGYFILELIVNEFLPKYAASLPITAVLLSSIPGMIIIKSIYVNLYKVQKKESRFFIDTLKYLAVGILLNVAFYMYYETLFSIALASVISIYLWALYPLSCFKVNMRDILKEIVYLILILGSFGLVISLDFNVIIKIVALTLILLVINLLFFKKMIINLIKMRL